MALKDILKQVVVTVAVSVATPIALVHAEKGLDLAKKGIQKVKAKLDERKGKKP